MNLPTDSMTSRMLKQQYSRAAMYISHHEFIRNKFSGNDRELMVIEFGGSNGYINSIFIDEVEFINYEVAPNYPEVDIQDLSNYQESTYDVVILDEILEHIENPCKAIAEVYRILRTGGYLITSSPLMIAVHRVPEDYWRFTEDGLRVLLKGFSEVKVSSWGNRKAVSYLMNGMMVTVEQAIIDGEFDLGNEKKYAIDVWGYAKK